MWRFTIITARVDGVSFYYGLRTTMLGVVPFTYFTNSGDIFITSYTGTNGTVMIGPVINGFPVTDIYFDDFTVPQEYTNLTSITIPASVTGIGPGAFYGCINLTNVTFLGNAPTLEYDVFDGDPATVYYYYGASGWGTVYQGLPVVEQWTCHSPTQPTIMLLLSPAILARTGR